MSAPRKKWRLKLIPGGRTTTAPSMTKAYERVGLLGDFYAERMSTFSEVHVQVDDGTGWALYERVIFPPRPEATP